MIWTVSHDCPLTPRTQNMLWQNAPAHIHRARQFSSAVHPARARFSLRGTSVEPACPGRVGAHLSSPVYRGIVQYPIGWSCSLLAQPPVRGHPGSDRGNSPCPVPSAEATIALAAVQGVYAGEGRYCVFLKTHADSLCTQKNKAKGLTFAFLGAFTNTLRLFREGLRSKCSTALSKSSWDFSGIRSWKGLNKHHSTAVSQTG